MPPANDLKYQAVDGLKCCRKCERILPVEKFYKKKGAVDGYNYSCKECVSDRGRKHYQANREQRIAYSKEWYRKNPEKAKARHAAYWEREGRERQHQRWESMTSAERAKYNQQQREARAADPERFRRYDLKRRLRKFGVTLEQYGALMGIQGGVCAICQGPPNGKDDVFHADHDHETGILRGLLCHSCNTSLGHFRDDVRVLQRAIDYLREPPFHRVTGEEPA